ncbi:hypothetical protein [Pengzhenrongella frigida]|uniref:Uncharacterized protein n=1 Tax=Pengzhenrongella frigida TaxID=1259133 RepID=A0A4Q5N3R5_9MICO|nr:hypothetical protein [Cellulomonas sp. HLT2-17]RYV52878.1 hypothetical protein EUA98_01410 [Cellulomonas sp. HLT2-17]
MNGVLAALVVVGALAVSVVGGWVLTSAVLRLASRSPDAGDDSGDGGPTGEGPEAALRGGTWIGVLERVAVTGALLAGYPAAIAFVIAIKGLGRYPELHKHPGASERFVIGTLASMVWASAVGLGGWLLLGGTIITS